MQDTLPIIDFTPFLQGKAQDKTASQIDEATRQHGFFYLIGHGIEAEIVRDCFTQARLFFDQDEATKDKIHLRHSPVNRGWFGRGEEQLDAKGQGDIKEGLKIGNNLPPSHPFVRAGIALHGANQYPQEQADFQPAMERAYNAFLHLGRQMMGAFALALGQEQTYFDRFLNTPMATLSPLRYPPLKAGESISAGVHTDFGCLTFLAQDDNAGLEIETPQGWQVIAPRPDALLVNIGDMLGFWTQGHYRPTRHRVINASKTRHSIDFFIDPQHDTPLAPLGQEDTNAPTALAHLLKKIDESLLPA